VRNLPDATDCRQDVQELVVRAQALDIERRVLVGRNICRHVVGDAGITEILCRGAEGVGRAERAVRDEGPSCADSLSIADCQVGIAVATAVHVGRRVLEVSRPAS